MVVESAVRSGATPHNSRADQREHVSIIAELRVSGPGATLLHANRAAPGVRLELERAVAPVEGEPALFLWATGEGFEAFEAAIPDDPTVDRFEVVEDVEGRRFYRVVVDRTETADSATIEQEVGASRLSAGVTAKGLQFEIRFPDWSALQRYVDLAREADLEVTLQAVYPANEGTPPERYGLSAKQLEVLERARAGDYFAVPRGTNLDAIADDLGISKQAASERLRRGLASLLDSTLGAEAGVEWVELSSSARPEEE